jgi:pyruvate/2-oxoglutarate dehydrogenase complex dihydrolipoamide acyltransferase (E2) component
MTPTATETQATTFRSIDENLRLVIEPKTEGLDERGRKVPFPGKAVEFRNGQFSTDDSTDLEFLRGHRLYNRDFYEVGNEPDRPKPEESAVIADMADAYTDGDADRIRESIRLEYASHSRSNVIATGKQLLEKLGEDPEQDTAPPQNLGHEEGSDTAYADATPAAVEAAEELGVDLADVKGTGEDGRVTKADVEAAAE